MRPPTLPQRLFIDLAVRAIAGLAAALYGGWFAWALVHALTAPG